MADTTGGVNYYLVWYRLCRVRILDFESRCRGEGELIEFAGRGDGCKRGPGEGWGKAGIKVDWRDDRGRRRKGKGAACVIRISHPTKHHRVDIGGMLIFGVITRRIGAYLLADIASF
jgi:hypothetical protein